MEKTCVEYVWIGGPVKTCPYSIRSKTRVLYFDNEITLDDIPVWNYDGSSTFQAETNKSEITIIPRALFDDPFRKGGKMVLCDTYIDDKPHPTNTRATADDIFKLNPSEEPWFGIEQEFFIMNKQTGLPIGFSETPQGQFYCSAGSRNAFGRSLVEKIFEHSITAGIQVSGMNAEVAPGQWEIQVGPLTGIEAGDHLWMLRYIMDRVTEDTDYYIELHPKPLGGEWNGSGAHTNFSTRTMREENGIDIIYKTINKLAATHDDYIKIYGAHNELRLTGKCETSSIAKFTHGIGDRTASVRIPSDTFKNKSGYFEDRRPSSLMDPYLVTSMLFQTTLVS